MDTKDFKDLCDRLLKKYEFKKKKRVKNKVDFRAHLYKGS